MVGAMAGRDRDHRPVPAVGGVARQQLKWIALAGAVAGIVLVASAATFFLLVTGIDTVRFVFIGLAFAGIPVAAGIAILRYRLYDIDVVINRALVYGALTATLGRHVRRRRAAVCSSSLSPLTEESDLAVAGRRSPWPRCSGRPEPGSRRRSTRFYRSRYDAARTLAAFSAGLRDEVDLDALGRELRDVVGTAMQPTHVSLWLRSADPVPSTRVVARCRVY